MADFSTIPCAEVFNTAKEKWTNTGRTASVRLRTAWANRYILMQDILGNARPWPYSVGLYPQSCGLSPESSIYVANGQGMDYTDAYVNVEYAVPGQEDVPDPTTLATESLEPTTEFLTEDPKLYQWETIAADPKVAQDLREGEEPGKLHHGIRLVRTLFNVASIASNVLTLPGSVNDAPYTSGLIGLTFPTDTLLFVPPQMNRTYTTAGATAWTVQLAWEYKESGWNKFWRQETQEMDYLAVRATGARYYSYPQKPQAPWLP